MLTREWAWRACVSRTFAVIVVPAIFLVSPAGHAQEEPRHKLQKNEKGWQVNVISAVLPETQQAKLQAKIEEDRLVCSTAGSAVLEIPLDAITRITRDTAKDYPAAEFLMGAALRPSTERHRFGSREYREEMAARAMLGGFAFLGLLFPRHKEVVTVFWQDDEGEHGAEFRLGRKQGRLMLQRLREESGVEPRDLEKERKDFEAARKELQRWIKKQSEKDRREQAPIM